MTGFGPRFAIEAGFVLLVATLAGLADLRPLLIVAAVAAAWLIVSLLELALWRSETRSAPATAIERPAETEPEGDVHEEAAEPAPVDVEEAARVEIEHEPELGDGTGYPLRADAGREPDGEADAYTGLLHDDDPGPAGIEPEAASAERRE